MNTIWNNASYRATINRTSGDMPTFNVKFVATIGGTTYTIDSSTIKQKNFATDSVSGDGFTFGDFVGRSCDLTFFDTSAAYSGVALKGAHGTLSYGVVSGGVTTWISYGTFVVEDVKRDGGVVWMSLVDLRKRFGEVGFTPSSTGLTLFQLAQEVVVAANVVSGLPTVSLGNTSSDMPNGSLVLTNVGLSEIKSGNSSVSLSQMVCYIAQASGTFATIGNDDKLYFKWYAEPTNACLIASTFVPNSIEISEYSVGVTGISWTDLEGNTTTNGADGYMIQITDNPLTFTNYATVLSGMASRVVGFTYTPLAFTYVGNPAIEVGDMITVVDDKNVSHLFPVTSMRYSNLLSQTISAVEGADSTDSGSTGLSITQQIKNSANNVIAYARIMELDADKITSGTIDADRIGANTITADKLVVTTGNLINDVDSFEQFKFATYGGQKSAGTTLVTVEDYAYHGKNSLRFGTAAANTPVYYWLNPNGTDYGFIRLTQTGKYILSCYVHSATSASGVYTLQGYGRAGITSTNSTGVTPSQASATIFSANGWVRLSTVIDVTSIADDPYLAIRAYVTCVEAGRNSYWDAFQLEYIGDRTDGIPSAFAVGGQTTINGDNITTGTLVAQVLTNDRTDPVCWASIGESVVDGETYSGMIMYHRPYSTTVPFLRVHTNGTTNPQTRIQLDTGAEIDIQKSLVTIKTGGIEANSAELRLDGLNHSVQLLNAGGTKGSFTLSETSATIYASDLTRATLTDGKIIITKSGTTLFDSSETRKSQSGSAIVNQTGTTTIYFPTAFTTTPHVFLQQSDPSAICPIRVVNTYSNRFEVQRTDSYTGSVNYNWFAVLP